MFSRDVVKRRISEGILAFPATPYDASDTVDIEGFEAHIAELARHRPTAMVVAGGAGELFSLSQLEHRTLVKHAAEVTPDIPVIAGVGFGVAIASDMARTAEEAGAAAILLFPPYLVASEQEGLARYVETVCRSVSIGVIVYNRGNGVLTPDTALRLAETCPNLIAVKDGVGDFETLTVLKQRAGDRLAVVNGVPTAEMIAPQCFSLGIRSYTSAVFTFLPTIALQYFRAVRDNDRPSIDRLLREFFVPLSTIRKRRHGYAVSIVKAGLRIVGRPAGHVRAPLVELAESDERELADLIGRTAELSDDARGVIERAAG